MQLEYLIWDRFCAINIGLETDKLTFHVSRQWDDRAKLNLIKQKQELKALKAIYQMIRLTHHIVVKFYSSCNENSKPDIGQIE